MARHNSPPAVSRACSSNGKNFPPKDGDISTWFVTIKESPKRGLSRTPDLKRQSKMNKDDNT